VLRELIGEARRRILSNEVFAQGANACSAAMAALILLLVLGSEVLTWQVVILTPLAALAIGAWLVRRRIPSRYQVAQAVDARLGLADTLSTAVFFEGAAASDQAETEVREAQRAQADRAAATADVKLAVPMRMPRSAYLMAALVLVAGSLFALRYGLARRLDLKQPLANFLPESLRSAKRTEQASNRQRNPKQIPEAPDVAGEGEDRDQRAQSEQVSDQQMDAETPQQGEEQANASSKQSGKQQKEQPDSEMATDDREQGNDSGAKNSDSADGKQGDSKNNQQQQEAGKNQEANNSGENSSLMDKMKDAFQNLLSRVKPPQQPAQSGQQQDQKGQQGKSQQGSKQQNKQGQQQNAGQQGDAQEGENGEQAQNDENTEQQKGQGKSDSQQASKQPGSGVGSQDGEKAIKNAEQLAAMGKLTEIMGKRSQTVTGEATVEVQQTSQQLKTSYVNKGAQHSQGGAEISRDEVPVALQPYVQQYFEQMRKQTGTAPVTKK
jgi:hypothetical protein